MSLDRYLQTSIKGTERFSHLSSDFFKEFISQRITHVYGQLYSSDKFNRYGDFWCYPQDQLGNRGESSFMTSSMNRFLHAYQEQKNIYLMEDRFLVPEEDGIKQKIAAADELIVIGFAFDQENLKRILWPWDKGNKKTVKYMNYNGEMKNGVIVKSCVLGIKRRID